MIVDKIENLPLYQGLVPTLSAAIAFIDGRYDLPAGRHEFPGGAVIATGGMSTPLSEKAFESHRVFTDVMVVLSGAESVSYRRIEDLSESAPYDPGSDCAFYNGEQKDIVVTVPAGYFYLVMPGEGHKPGIHIGTPAAYSKYILKCRMDV